MSQQASGGNSHDNNSAAANNSPIVHPVDGDHVARYHSNDQSSGDNTLANDEIQPRGEKHADGLGVPEGQPGMKRSANSSMDHVAELGEARVSVRRGKEEFAALERRFSNLSQHSQDLQRIPTRRSIRSGFVKPEKTLSTSSSGPTPGDAEKGRAGGEEEEFDLVQTLRTGKEKSDQAGIKHKAIGVVWEDLEVIGAGGLRINIRNFSNAVMEQFMASTQRPSLTHRY